MVFFVLSSCSCAPSSNTFLSAAVAVPALSFLSASFMAFVFAVASLISFNTSRKNCFTGAVTLLQPRPIFSLKSPHAFASCTVLSAIAAAWPLYCLAIMSIALPASSSSLDSPRISLLASPSSPAKPEYVLFNCTAIF